VKEAREPIMMASMMGMLTGVPDFHLTMKFAPDPPDLSPCETM